MSSSFKNKPLKEHIYEIVRQIPAGKVASYGQIAMLAGKPRAARVVGMAMSRCTEENVPCHRVVNAAGRLAPSPAFTVAGGQRMLLEMEGVAVSPDGFVDLCLYRWNLSPEGKGGNDESES